MATPIEIRKEGLEALYERLGSYGTLRFLAQFETGYGDYTKDRHKILPEMDVSSIADEIYKRRK